MLTRATDALRALEEEIANDPLDAGGEDALHVIERMRDVRRLLSREDVEWIGTTEAKRLLGVGSENTVKAWAKRGLLRSRTQPNGRIHVLLSERYRGRCRTTIWPQGSSRGSVRLDDVLKEREAREAITASGGRDLADEELHRSRPGTLPWEREQAGSAG